MHSALRRRGDPRDRYRGVGISLSNPLLPATSRPRQLQSAGAFWLASCAPDPVVSRPRGIYRVSAETADPEWAHLHNQRVIIPPAYVRGCHLQRLARIEGHAEKIPVDPSGESAAAAALGMCGSALFVIMRGIENPPFWQTDCLSWAGGIDLNSRPTYRSLVASSLGRLATFLLHPVRLLCPGWTAP